MKAKLLAIVSPMPSPAILAADLEEFRTSIYNMDSVKEDAEEPIDLPASLGNSMCSWCGIWQPLPIAPICSQQMAVDKYGAGALGNQPTVARLVDAVAAESDPDNTRLGELGNQPTVATEVAVAAVPDPLTSRVPHAPRSPKMFSAESMAMWKEPLQASYLVQTRMRRYIFKKQPWHAAAASCNNVFTGESTSISSNLFESAELLAPLLCEVVSKHRCTNRDVHSTAVYDKLLRKQRAAALRARWVDRPYNGLPWLPRLVPDTNQYTTDPETGECKVQ